MPQNEKNTIASVLESDGEEESLWSGIQPL